MNWEYTSDDKKTPAKIVKRLKELEKKQDKIGFELSKLRKLGRQRADKIRKSIIEKSN